MTQPNMPSAVPLLPPQKGDRDAFTWKIWAPIQEITERSGQTVARSERSAPVGRLKLQMNLMIVHPAIQEELIPGRLLEREARPPVLVVLLREGESSLREIDGGDIRNERIVQALKGHPVGGSIEDGAPPTGGV